MACTREAGNAPRDFLLIRLYDFRLKAENIPRLAQIGPTGYCTAISLHPKQMDGPQIEEIYRACL